jgi:excisionase family DNA binding protein
MTAPLTGPQQRALQEFGDLLAAGNGTPPRVIVMDAEGHQRELSPETVGALAPAVATAARVLASDMPFAALPDDAELTTTKAARFLKVSRQYFARLLDQGVIPYRMVGTHHRVRLGDLRAFKARQRAAIRDLAQLSVDLGIYDM